MYEIRPLCWRVFAVSFEVRAHSFVHSFHLSVYVWAVWAYDMMSHFQYFVQVVHYFGDKFPAVVADYLLVESMPQYPLV